MFHQQSEIHEGSSVRPAPEHRLLMCCSMVLNDTVVAMVAYRPSIALRLGGLQSLMDRACQNRTHVAVDARANRAVQS